MYTMSIANLRHPIWLLVAAAAFATAGCGGNADGTEDADDGEAEVRIPVQIEPVKLGGVSAAYEGTATLDAEREATVVARTSGVLLELEAEAGDVVNRGDILARLDDDRHRLEVAQARAQLNRLKSDFERTEELHERELVSSDQFEQIRSEYESQRASFEMAELELSYTEIRAPIDGVISERMVKEGNWIQEQQPLFQIADLSSLEAVLDVPERELSLLETGYPVTVLTDALPGQSFEGRVKRISPVVNPDSGTFDVTVDVPNEDGTLKPGLFVRARIVYDTREGVPLIPRSSLLTEDGKDSVFVVEDGVARKTDLVVGYDDGRDVEVKTGLQEGEQVVTLGQASLRDGSPVEIVEPDQG